MKKVLLLLGITLSLQAGYAQIHAKVDERFELTSTVFALAGVPQFCQCAIPSYRQDIRKFGEKFDLTEPIEYIRELHQIHGISYDAVSTTAEMLEIKRGKIRLQSQYDISKISEIDSRWNQESFAKYIKMLNVFYKQSNFHKFFKKRRPLYDIAEQRMDKLLEGTAIKWFEDFFGKQFNADDNLSIYLCMVNGPNNYAMPHGVLIGIGADKDGLPNPNNTGTTIMLIHEIGHHYIDPLFEAYWPQMEVAANKMYPYVKDKMAKLAYGSARTTLCEWLNNLFVLMYLRETGIDPEKFTLYITSYVNNGFIWMQHSVDFMNDFYANRDQYPHIEDFMPKLVDFINSTADNYDSVIREYENQKPYIIDVNPALGSDISNTNEIVITFSKPMSIGKWAFYGTGSTDVKIKFLEVSQVKWADDGLSVTLVLNKEKIKDKGIYGIQLFPRGFTTPDNIWLDDRCKNLLFKIE